MQICEVFDLCCGIARRRACGHVACDDCSDAATNVCLDRRPNEPVEYLQFHADGRVSQGMAVGHRSALGFGMNRIGDLIGAMVDAPLGCHHLGYSWQQGRGNDWYISCVECGTQLLYD
jgi:hypothetical protein